MDMALSNRVNRQETLKFWGHAFGAGSRDSAFLHKANILHIDRSTIYTGKLVRTRNLFRNLSSGNVIGFFPHDETVVFVDALNLLALGITHQRLALSRAADMLHPGFWLRHEGRRLPAFPSAQFQAMSGLSGISFRMLIASLCSDGALKLAANETCAEAVVVMPGFSPAHFADR